MQKLHKPSGCTIKTEIIYYEEIKKYSPGVVIINTDGMKTRRIATEPNYYNLKEDAENASFEAGEALLSRYLSEHETLYFDQ
ncbi:MAG: hypothetical protein PHO08_17230 [Methylococcales bacterium]|nr:hypothetical protein [Methylococcales bacterium]MDD5631544.1 hypothetical protein [Methylococcales bacterium]